MPKAYPLNFPPGVQRDGTRLDTECSVEALWNRWRLGRPRKMGGYKSATGTLGGIGRRIHAYYRGDRIFFHIGHSAGIQQVILDNKGNFISQADRTPADFIGGISPGWTIDALFDTVSNGIQVIAHSNPNVSIAADNYQTPPFSGAIDETTPLIRIPGPSTNEGGNYPTSTGGPLFSGGIVCVQPYLFSMDSDGSLGWSAPNDPRKLGVYGGSSGAGRARVSAQKFVAGKPLRGGGANSPAAIFWSLSDVVTAAFVGQTGGWFAFNTASDQSSILSGMTVIEDEGLFYWVGIDRFLMFNGTVLEIPNNYNQDWFFDNLNWDYAGKAFAFKVPRFGEIWFCAPLFGATEPSHAVIYNKREKCWYDTALPDGGRSAAHFAQGFRYPVMTGVDPTNDLFELWVHERGRDKINSAGLASPVRAFVSTPFIGGPRANPPDDSGVSAGTLEADIRQTGDMAIVVSGGGNARAADVATQAVILQANPATPDEQLVSFKKSERLVRFIFESNTMGGDYIFGKNIVHFEPGPSKKHGAVGKPLSTPPEEPRNDPDAPLTVPATPLEDFTDAD